MILRYLLWAFLAWCIYKFVFDFLIPLFRVTRRMKRQMREFQKKAEGQFENYQNDNVNRQEPPPAQKAGEYIDFEEIKEK